MSFGDRRSLFEITPDQMRRFADTARIPGSPLWPMVAETAKRTVNAWEGLAEKELLPGDMRLAIGKHILTVATAIRDNPPRLGPQVVAFSLRNGPSLRDKKLGGADRSFRA